MSLTTPAPLGPRLAAFINPSLFGGGGPRPAPAPHAAGGRDARAARPRVLVVDDAPDVAEMVGVMMTVAGYEVETALSAAAALEIAGRSSFDVVISDIGMPFMNGYELAERLRRLPGYEAVPLLAVTGFTMYDDRARALASGFDDFLTKPIRTDDLLGAVERLRK